MTYVDPLISSVIGAASQMISNKQQTGILDQTKVLCENAANLISLVKDNKGNKNVSHQNETDIFSDI